ncbi:MAG: hypothetical protein KAW17_08660 [Candidatus Eisenbacteria sp.]|nr:hypothetical protein [Candidatus Eisenbacteria bacterium]
MDLAVNRDRYLRDAVPIRLGGLAANLGRVQSFSGHPDHRDVVHGLLEESKLFIEWTARDLDIDLQIELADLQREIVRWQRSWTAIWSDPSQRTALASRAGVLAQHLLNTSGLLD